jgi:hypothetical protein
MAHVCPLAAWLAGVFFFVLSMALQFASASPSTPLNDFEQLMQIAIPSQVTPQEIAREKTLGGSIALCAKAAGFEPKEVMDAIRVDGKPMDKAQWSRWESGQEGVMWPKLTALMDFCGNDAPVLWQAHARGWDIASIRRIESEVERENRLLREENAALKRVLTGAKA